MQRYRDPPCSIEKLPSNIDAVIISHTHYDHLDKKSVVDLDKKYAETISWYVPMGSGTFFTSLGIKGENVHELVWWEEAICKDGKIIFTPANHYSRRSTFDENLALWGSFAIIGKDGNKFWFGGDTAYCDVFKQIGRKLGPFQLSAIPIGAYSPRSALKYNHVDPQEAVQIHYDIMSDVSFGIHWGTFKMGATEHYLDPKKEIEKMRTEAGTCDNGEDKLKFYTVNIGDTHHGKCNISQ